VYSQWRPKALKLGWIRPSKANHSCAIFYVPKKNLELRLCVNYIPLNAITKKFVYAPASSRQLRSRITQATWYVSIDLENAFHAIPVRESDRWKTAFRTPHGVYEWCVMPFGLTNAPGTFQRYAERVLQGLPFNITIHIDDILVYEATRSSCEKALKAVLKRLHTHELPVNRDKSVLIPTTTIVFTGYKFSNGCSEPCIDTKTLSQWPIPRTPTQLRAFLGTINVMRDYIPNHAKMAQPLFSSTGKNWTWTPNQHQAFLRLREKSTQYIRHQRYDPASESALVTDASLFAIAAWHFQGTRPIALWSRALTPAERNYTADERELLAVVEALKTWQYDLESSIGILVRTDNMINTATLKESKTNRRKNRWIEYLSQYKLTWQHLPGARNPADSPSRRPDYK